MALRCSFRSSSSRRFRRVRGCSVQVDVACCIFWPNKVLSSLQTMERITECIGYAVWGTYSTLCSHEEKANQRQNRDQIIKHEPTRCKSKFHVLSPPTRNHPQVKANESTMFGSSRPADEPGETEIPMNKRRRINKSTACTACIKRKSRCELMQVDGCLRCRTLKTPCSLIDDEDAIRLNLPDLEASAGGASPSVNPDLQATLKIMMDRMARMEEGIVSINNRLGMSASAQTQTCRVRLPEDAHSSLRSSPLGLLSRAVCLERSFCGFDPVSEGILSLVGYDEALHR